MVYLESFGKFAKVCQSFAVSAESCVLWSLGKFGKVSESFWWSLPGVESLASFAPSLSPCRLGKFWKVLESLSNPLRPSQGIVLPQVRSSPVGVEWRFAWPFARFFRFRYPPLSGQTPYVYVGVFPGVLSWGSFQVPSGALQDAPGALPYSRVSRWTPGCLHGLLWASWG